MRPIRPVTPWGELFLAGQSMHTYAWLALDIRPLYAPQTYRSGNTIIPGATGRRPDPYRIDECDFAVPMRYTSACDQSGTPYADRFVGYEQNVAALNALAVPPTPPTATIDGLIVTASGAELTADVQVLGFDQGSVDEMLGSPFVWRGILNLRIPAGYFS